MKKKLLIAAILAVIKFVAVAADDATTTIRHFCWGVEAGGSIDMTSHDMSSININASFGYKNNFIQMAGLGAGIDMMVNNGSRCFPIYGVLRTSFVPQPKLLFMDLRIGAVFNQLPDDTSKSALYLQPGIGIKLASSPRFQAYILAAYGFNGLRTRNLPNPGDYINRLHTANIRIGVSF